LVLFGECRTDDFAALLLESRFEFDDFIRADDAAITAMLSHKLGHARRCFELALVAVEMNDAFGARVVLKFLVLPNFPIERAAFGRDLYDFRRVAIRPPGHAVDEELRNPPPLTHVE